MGFRDKFWVLAILMDTGWNSSKNWAQQKGLPQMPRPPSIRASSRTPICLSSMRARKMPARSFTKARKSTRPSAVKKKIILEPSKLYSTLTSFISKPCCSICFWAIFMVRPSLALFSSTCLQSRSVAARITGRKGWTTAKSSTMVLARTQVPYSKPLPVSTITPCPSWNCVPLGSK